MSRKSNDCSIPRSPADPFSPLAETIYVRAGVVDSTRNAAARTQRRLAANKAMRPDRTSDAASCKAKPAAADVVTSKGMHIDHYVVE